MAKKNFQNQFSGTPPKTLQNENFYGLNLDDEQKAFRDAIYDSSKLVVVCNSKAGTGKSTIALGTANILVQYGLYSGIVYIVSPTMEQKQGFLPGGVEEKTAPYIEPLLDAMNTLGIPESCLISDDNPLGLKTGTSYIRFTPHTYMRGCNLERQVVILEECQNFFFDELKKVLTRIHDTCKVIVIGHTEQCDIIKKPERSGFKVYLNAFEAIEDDPRVAICNLTTNHRGWFSSFCDSVTF